MSVLFFRKGVYIYIYIYGLRQLSLFI